MVTLSFTAISQSDQSEHIPNNAQWLGYSEGKSIYVYQKIKTKADETSLNYLFLDIESGELETRPVKAADIGTERRTNWVEVHYHDGHFYELIQCVEESSLTKYKVGILKRDAFTMRIVNEFRWVDDHIYGTFKNLPSVMTIYAKPSIPNPTPVSLAIEDNYLIVYSFGSFDFLKTLSLDLESLTEESFDIRGDRESVDLRLLDNSDGEKEIIIISSESVQTHTIGRDSQFDLYGVLFTQFRRITISDNGEQFSSATVQFSIPEEFDFSWYDFSFNPQSNTVIGFFMTHDFSLLSVRNNYMKIIEWSLEGDIISNQKVGIDFNEILDKNGKEFIENYSEKTFDPEKSSTIAPYAPPRLIQGQDGTIMIWFDRLSVASGFVAKGYQKNLENSNYALFYNDKSEVKHLFLPHLETHSTRNRIEFENLIKRGNALVLEPINGKVHIFLTDLVADYEDGNYEICPTNKCMKEGKCLSHIIIDAETVSVIERTNIQNMDDLSFDSFRSEFFKEKNKVYLLFRNKKERKVVVIDL